MSINYSGGKGPFDLMGKLDRDTAQIQEGGKPNDLIYMNELMGC